jgi:hypothetical protein
VSLASGSESLAAAISLRAHPATANVQVVVALDDEQSGTALALRSEGANYAQGVEPFGVLSTALTPALTLQGMNEQLARAKHSDYVRAEREKGETGAAVVPWDELPETLKDSNRRFADGVGAVLKAAGCTIAPAPLIDANGPLFQFTQDEVEELAKREHDRWMRDLLNDGWQPTSGPKDPVAKLHPGLISWKDLTEGEREKDRAPMRLLPQMMARVGFELYRTREDRA